MNCDIHHIYQKYNSHLFAFIRQQIKDESTANDVLQEVFLKTMESCLKDRDIQNLKSWLFYVTRNTIIDYFRRQSKNIREEDYINLNHLNSADFQQILSEDVADMISLLPKEYALPLQWSDIDGIPQKDIAEKLNISLPGAKSRIQRARKNFASYFLSVAIWNSMPRAISFRAKLKVIVRLYSKKELTKTTKIQIVI